MTEFLANQRQSYNKWTREVIRYADLDPVGHVNNNAYGLFIENARTVLFMDVENKIKGIWHQLFFSFINNILDK